MKTTCAQILLGVAALAAPFGNASAQVTAFTYQGRLSSGGSPATGSYDLRFALYDAASNGAVQGNLLTSSATAVSNGLFTVTLDFGNQFPGGDRWLEISVRTNGAAGFFTLSPRQAVTAAPYAITAGRVLSGGLAAGTYGNAVTLNNAANQVSGSFAGDGLNVTNVNAATVGGIGSAGFWQTNGNAGADPANGAFIGTADNLPVEVRAGNQRAWRVEPNYSSPNLIGGCPANAVNPAVAGGFIGGGGNVAAPNNVSANYGAVLGGAGNGAAAEFATAMGFGSVASGYVATAMGNHSVAGGSCAVAMGQGSQANGINSFASGEACQASGLAATAMGYHSTATNSGSTAIGAYALANQNAIALGANASANGEYASALGNYVSANGYQSTAIGYGCVASGITSVAIGNLCVANGNTATALGYASVADHPGTFVWADTSSDKSFQSTGANQFLIRATGGVGINTPNPLGNALCVSGDARVDAQPAAWNEGLAINCPTNMTANGGFGGIHFHSTGPGQDFSSGSIQWAEMYNYAPEIGNAVGGGLAFIHNNSATALYLAASGNVGIGTTAPAYQLQVAGSCAATTFVTTSDRNAKENFQPVRAQEVLAKVAALPLSRWNYKTDKTQQHLGPMAQDFYAAFQVGPDDTHITTVDEGGVALAAIQGLNEKLELQSRQLAAENAELKARLERLEKLISVRE